MDPGDLLTHEFQHHDRVAATTLAAVREPFVRLVEVTLDSLRAGGKVMFFGNGGSAADAQHLATELSIRYLGDRAPIAGLSLATDGSALTAAGNDLGFERVFARQVEALGRPGDVALAISTSGRSRNIVLALEMARGKGLTAAALCGHDGGDLRGLADPLVVVPSDVTPRIQEMHIVIGHAFCAALEQGLGLV